MKRIIQNNDLTYNSFPFTDLKELREVFWVNPNRVEFSSCRKHLPFKETDVSDAADRLSRFASYISKAFPETASMNGIIESPIRAIPEMQKALSKQYGMATPKKLLIKLDSHLAVSGSIKARGGIYEVLKFAEETALKHSLLKINDDYSILHSEQHRKLFNEYSIIVGSTGNLGLSIGIMGAKLGFRVTVHMSADARTWKKKLLRAKGVQVVEHPADYSEAVAVGRKQAQPDPFCQFVDDENSKDLFLGYAVAAGRLKKQLEENSIPVDAEHPLFVYLPCGVGGGPGGITYGLKLQFGDNVHCFFGEPTQAPAMLVGLASGLHDQISAKDLGIEGKTDADGLAVSRPSGLVAKTMEPLLSGVYTVSDDEMYRLLSLLYNTERFRLEPSALVGFPGALRVSEIVSQLNITAQQFQQATHLIWATGGNMVPDTVWQKYAEKGASLLAA